MADNSYTDIMEKSYGNPWHDYARQDGNILIDKAGLIEKASVIGRVGLIMLSCGTGAWRVRTSHEPALKGAWVSHVQWMSDLCQSSLTALTEMTVYHSHSA